MGPHLMWIHEMLSVAVMAAWGGFSINHHVGVSLVWGGCTDTSVSRYEMLTHKPDRGTCKLEGAEFFVNIELV
jgi:hypothetical protein